MVEHEDDCHGCCFPAHFFKGRCYNCSCPKYYAEHCLQERWQAISKAVDQILNGATDTVEPIAVLQAQSDDGTARLGDNKLQRDVRDILIGRYLEIIDPDLVWQASDTILKKPNLVDANEACAIALTLGAKSILIPRYSLGKKGIELELRLHMASNTGLEKKASVFIPLDDYKTDREWKPLESTVVEKIEIWQLDDACRSYVKGSLIMDKIYELTIKLQEPAFTYIFTIQAEGKINLLYPGNSPDVMSCNPLPAINSYNFVPKFGDDSGQVGIVVITNSRRILGINKLVQKLEFKLGNSFGQEDLATLKSIFGGMAASSKIEIYEYR
jgi:hypothetical protein